MRYRADCAGSKRRFLGRIFLVLLLALPAAAEKAESADAFVDSVGINIHLHDGGTPYANFVQVQQALQALGVRHVRDGLIDTSWNEYYERHNQLGRLGIKGLFVTSPGEGASLLLDYPRRMKDSFEGYEAPNEYDQSQDPNWVTTVTSFVAKLQDTISNDARSAGFPVVGPSLTRADSYLKLRGVCSFDYENLHDYFAGRNPGTPGWGGNGYGSIVWNLSNVNTACPGKPVVTTETGYQTAPAVGQGIPEEVAARYVPRVLLEQWLSGVTRTYLYELIDLPSAGPANAGFGLLRSDYSRKPGYSALMSLLQLLKDPGPSFTCGELGFGLTGDLLNVHHLLLEKRSGLFYLMLWVEESGYDVNKRKSTPVSTRLIAIQNEKKVKMIQNSLDASGALQTVLLPAGFDHEIEVTDSVTILEIDPRPAAPVLDSPVIVRLDRPPQQIPDAVLDMAAKNRGAK